MEVGTNENQANWIRKKYIEIRSVCKIRKVGTLVQNQFVERNFNASNYKGIQKGFAEDNEFAKSLLKSKKNIYIYFFFLFKGN